MQKKTIDSKKRIYFDTLRLLFFYCKKNRNLFIWAVILSIISQVCFIIGFFAVGRGIEDTFSLLLDPQVNFNQKLNSLIISIVFLTSMYAIDLICYYYQCYLLAKAAQNIGFEIRTDLFNKIQKLPFSYLDKQSVGNLMSCLTNDVDVVIFGFSKMSAQIMNNFFQIIGIFIALLLVNPVVSSIAFALIIVLMFFIVILIKRAQPYFDKQQKIIGDLNGVCEENIYAHKLISLFKYENDAIKDFEIKNHELEKNIYFSQIISGTVFPYNNFVCNSVVAIIALLQITFACFVPKIAFISVTGLDQVALIVLYMMLIRQFVTPISIILSGLNQIQLSISALWRLNDILTQQAESELYENKHIVLKEGEVIFDNVSFCYNPNKPVLKNISFRVKPNSQVAIIGPTGSGKTTIISLLSRYYDLTDGKILLDGQDISLYSRSSVRKNIAVVLQDTYLFSGTVIDNIKLGRIDATDEEAIEAAKVAYADHFISRLPNGYYTKINDKSVSFSEGEKQLIAIARALVSKAKIIILDEATSYVDTKIEKIIQSGIKNLIKDKTTFIIAHRLSTIKQSDNIIVINKGELIEQGTNQELLNAKGFYHQLNMKLEENN